MFLRRFGFACAVDVAKSTLTNGAAATASIPGLFPSVSIGGRSYVDGGFRGALPLWAAADLGATHVIAVDCLATLRWQILRKIVSPRRPLDGLKVSSIVPSEPFGPIKYSVVWSRWPLCRADNPAARRHHIVYNGSLCRVTGFIT